MLPEGGIDPKWLRKIQTIDQNVRRHKNLQKPAGSSGKAATGNGTESHLCAFTLLWELSQLHVPWIPGLAWILVFIFHEICFSLHKHPKYSSLLLIN